MAAGDNHFLLVKSGSAATSANTAHILWGDYGGLSALNNSEVVHIQIMPQATEARISDSNDASNDVGYGIFPTASYVDLPAMRVGLASALHWANGVLGTNASAFWSIWRRSAGPVR